MAPSSGTENTDVTGALDKVRELLFAEPYSFDFFQSVRVLGWLQPGRSPVGRYSHPQNEVVRFGANPILHFPASAIHALREQPDASPAMTVNFMGLVGPLGALAELHHRVDRRAGSAPRTTPCSTSSISSIIA